LQIRKTLNRGFVFTFEAILALLLFALMLFAIPTQSNTNLEELLILQQSNDLLRVWSQSYPNEQELINDTKLVFQDKAIVKLNDKGLTTCFGKNKIATEGVLLDNLLIENKITIIVCYN
jgi:hypothetical protein